MQKLSGTMKYLVNFALVLIVLLSLQSCKASNQVQTRKSVVLDTIRRNVVVSNYDTIYINDTVKKVRHQIINMCSEEKAYQQAHTNDTIFIGAPSAMLHENDNEKIFVLMPYCCIASLIFVIWILSKQRK